MNHDNELPVERNDFHRTMNKSLYPVYVYVKHGAKPEKISMQCTALTNGPEGRPPTCATTTHFYTQKPGTIGCQDDIPYVL